MRIVTLLLIIIIIIIIAAVAAAPPATGQAPLASRFLLAAATDAKGDPLVGLLPSDFIVEEDGARRDVIEVRPAEYPVAILLDTSEPARRDFVRLRTATRHMTERLTGRLLSLTTFGDTPARVVPFTTDLSKVTRAIESSFARPETDSYLLDAIIEVARDVRRRELPMCAIVVVSAGGIDRSARAPIDVLEPVMASRSIVHIAETRTMRASGRLTRPRGIRRHIDSGEQAAMALEDFLRALTERTGGRYDPLFSGGAFDEALQAIARRLTSEVIVEYAVPPGAPPSANLRVGLRIPDVTVRGRGLPKSPW